MNDLLQQFADTLTEGIRKRTDELRERKALKRMNDLCDEIDKQLAAKPTRLDDYVKRCFKKTKSHPQPIYILTFGAVWPIPDAELLEAFKKAGFQVTATNRVYAAPTKAERKRRKLHHSFTWRRGRLLRRYLALCEALLGEAK